MKTRVSLMPQITHKANDQLRGWGELLAELCRSWPDRITCTPSIWKERWMASSLSSSVCTPSHALFMIVALYRSAHSRPQWPVPGHRMDAEPCRFFVWNVASAARFCECSRHLESVADQTLWEGESEDIGRESDLGLGAFHKVGAREYETYL